MTAIKTKYDNAGVGQVFFNAVFADGQNATVVLDKNLTNNYEVRNGEFRTLYLKTASIDTADYSTAILFMDGDTSWFGKATPLKEVHIIKLA